MEVGGGDEDDDEAALAKNDGAADGTTDEEPMQRQRMQMPMLKPQMERNRMAGTIIPKSESSSWKGRQKRSLWQPQK